MNQPKKKTSNYVRGRGKEYEVVKRLRELGYEAARSASSHGLWDVSAAGQGETILIQVKYTKQDKYYEDENCRKFRALRVASGTRKELWIFRHGKKGVEIVDLTKPKPDKKRGTEDGNTKSL